jgi:hypothetical protein
LTLPSKDEKKDCFAFEESKEKRVTKGYAIGCALGKALKFLNGRLHS